MKGFAWWRGLLKFHPDSDIELVDIHHQMFCMWIRKSYPFTATLDLFMSQLWTTRNHRESSSQQQSCFHKGRNFPRLKKKSSLWSTICAVDTFLPRLKSNLLQWKELNKNTFVMEFRSKMKNGKSLKRFYTFTDWYQKRSRTVYHVNTRQVYRWSHGGFR